METKIKEAEMRRFPRIDEVVCAWLSFRKEQAAYGTLTMDIGLEGARFSTLHEVRVGDQLIVCLQLPWQNIECKGKVCWTGAGTSGLPCFGVRFLDLRETERDFLDRYLAKAMAPSSESADLDAVGAELDDAETANAASVFMY